MKFPSREFDDAVAALCHGTVSGGTVAIDMTGDLTVTGALTSSGET